MICAPRRGNQSNPGLSIGPDGRERRASPEWPTFRQRSVPTDPPAGERQTARSPWVPSVAAQRRAGRPSHRAALVAVTLPAHNARVRLAAVVTLCLSTVASAAPSDFAKFVAQFPPLALPLASEKTKLPLNKLSPDDAMTWVVEPLSAVGDASNWTNPINFLRGFSTPAQRAQARTLLRGKPSDDGLLSSLRVSARGSASRGSVILLVVGVDLEASMYRPSDTWLLTWSSDGRFIGALLLAQHVPSEAGSALLTGTLAEDGTIARSFVQFFDTREKEMPEYLEVESTWPARLLDSGRFEESPASWAGPAGRFIDRTSHEELQIFAGQPARVFYRANEAKPWQALVVPAGAKRPSFAVQFAGAPKEKYVLTWDERGTAITCRTPGESSRRSPASSDEDPCEASPEDRAVHPLRRLRPPRRRGARRRGRRRRLDPRRRDGRPLRAQHHHRAAGRRGA